MKASISRQLVACNQRIKLFDEIRYLFYITNDRPARPAKIVFGCNDRCDQENLIAQLAGGVRALAAPVDNLISNGPSVP